MQTEQNNQNPDQGQNQNQTQDNPPNNQNPPVTPPAQAAPGVQNTNSTQAVPPKNNKKKVGIIVGLIIAVLLIAGSAAAYFFAYLPNTPENVLLQGLYNTLSREEVKSGKVDGTLKLSGDNIPEQLGDIDVVASFAENGDIGATISTSLNENTYTAEIRQIGEGETYTKFNGLNNLDDVLNAFNSGSTETNQTLQLFAPILSKLDDQWIRADETAREVTGDSTELLNATNLSNEDADKVAEIYQRNPIIEIVEVMPDDEVNGESSKHFKTKINKDNYVNFLSELKEANIDGLTVEQSDIEAAKDEDFSKFSQEIWVKKSDKTINQVLFTGEDD